MRLYTHAVLLVAAILATAGISNSYAESSSQMAQAPTRIQALIEEKGAAVVTLEVVLEMKSSYGGQQNESERKFDGLATIVDPSGLAVAALSTIDPGAFYARMSGSEDSFVTRVRSLKYIMSDNTEIPAAIVLRDPDLDLVFLKPLTPPSTPFTAIPLTDSCAPKMLDPVYTISRTNRITRRTIMGQSGEIQGLVRAPRLFYLPSSSLVGTRSTGTPIFCADGKLVGIVAMYLFPGGSRALGDQDQPYTYSIVAAEDVLDVANQAVEAPPEVVPVEEPEVEATDGEPTGEVEDTAEPEAPATEE